VPVIAALLVADPNKAQRGDEAGYKDECTGRRTVGGKGEDVMAEPRKVSGYVLWDVGPNARRILFRGSFGHALGDGGTRVASPGRHAPR
jgi:hypothetical protein